MKKISLVLSISVVIFLFLNCEKDSQNSENENKNGFVVMTNSNDPLITNYSGKDAQIDFFGQRNENGVPINIDQIVVKKPNDTTYYKLDSSGRPVNIYTQNGTQFEFNWITKQKAVLKILSNDGLTQLITDLDLSLPDGKLKSNTNNTENLNRNNKRISLTYRETPSGFFTNSKITANENCLVNVKSCGFPDDNVTVRVNVSSLSGKYLGNFPTERVDKGKFIANIPTNLAPKLELSEVCNSIVGALDKVCIINESLGFNELMCIRISAAVAASGIASALSAPIFSACLAATVGIDLYCTTAGSSPAPGAPSAADLICSAQVFNRTFEEDILVSAYVVALPYNVKSSSIKSSGNGPFPILNIELNPLTAVRKIILNPAAPSANEDYTITCDISCLIAGSIVNLSVVGSDQYTDDISYPITNLQKEGEFTLTVPGAETGVKDDITLKIMLPDGSILKRTIFLTFK